MFKINEQLSREENIALAEASAVRAKELYDGIKALVDEGFKHVPNYSGTKTQQTKARSAQEVLNRLYSEMQVHSRLKATYATRDRMEQEAVAKKAAEQLKQQREDEMSQLLNDAVKYLLEHGKQVGTDFKVENAIAAANNLAFELEVTRREAEADGPIDFSGDDNCEDCSGWTPGDRRCECGNRRVGWTEGWGHSFKSPSIYAEAY